MKLYIFEDVLCDWTSGMAVIAANTLKQAQDYAFKEFGYSDTVELFLQREGEGFNVPTGIYQTQDAEHGTKHYVYGAG